MTTEETEEQATVLAGRYRLGPVIGRGGMADVYRATDELLEREVAVKVLRARTAGERERARFETEARTVAQLDHPHLVSLLDAGIDQETPYLVMDLVEGRSLAAACADGPLPAATVARIGGALADALGYVHEHDVVHRDLKPGNVLLGHDGGVSLADFGIARLLGDTSGHTATGTLVGTAAYLAPEQVRGNQVSPATDVYSLGLLLLEALTGVRAYTGTPTEAALARLHTPPPIPGTLPEGWESLIRAMTHLDPAHRPSARQAGRALRRLATMPADPAPAAPGDPAAPAPAEPASSESRRAAVPAARHNGDTQGFAVPDLEPARPAAGATAAPPTAGPTADRSPAGATTGRRRRRGRGWVWAGVGALAVLAGVGVAAMLLTMPETSHATPVPPGVQAELRRPLADLHDAVDGGPLTPALDAVDRSARAERWRRLRRDLDDLVRAAVRAESTGEVSGGQARDVEAAAARLAVQVPRP